MSKNPVNGVAILTKDLVKNYAPSGAEPGVCALDAVNLEVPAGSIYGLLGPNGAGKSTFINILAGLVVKSSGQAIVWGFDIEKHPRNARAALGVVPQEINYDPFFTPFELLELHAGLYGVPKAERRTMELLKALGLEDKANSYTRTLSGGMKRRLLTAKALVHSPPILILDEPTAGVDVELRQHLWAYVRELHEKGVTIVLTTHYLEEAEALCDHIAIIDQGKVIASQATPELLKRLDCKRLVIRPDDTIDAIPPELADFAPELTLDGDLVLSFKPTKTPTGQVLAALRQAGITIADITTREADLEEVFLSLTRRNG